MSNEEGIHLHSLRFKRFPALILALMLFGSIGCSTTKPAATAGQPSGQAAPAPAPAADKPPVKIGLLLTYSKVYAVVGNSITDGMSLYFDQVNWTAGGRKVELVKEDDEVDAQVGARKAKKLIDQDKVDFLAGIVSTPVGMAIRDIVHENQVITFVANAGNNALTRERKSPYLFRTSFTNWQISYPMGEWVYKNVAKKVFISAADYGGGRESAAAFKEAFTKAGGQVLGEVYPPLGTQDFAPFMTEIAKAKPEATWHMYAGTDAVRFVKYYKEVGLQVPLLGAGWLLDTDTFEGQGKAGLGGKTSLNYLDTLDTPENKAFVAAFKKKFNREPDAYALQGYDTARVIVEALNKVQGNTGDKQALIKAIEQVSFTSPRGPFSFDPDTHNVVQNIYIREVKEEGGKLVNVLVATVPNVKDPGK